MYKGPAKHGPGQSCLSQCLGGGVLLAFSFAVTEHSVAARALCLPSFFDFLQFLALKEYANHAA